jgi:HD domain
MTIQTVQTDTTWRSRPLLSAGVRLLAYGTPIVIGTVIVRVVSPSLNEAFSRLPATMIALGLAVTVSLLVSRLTMRLMPLVVLLRMTMLFPDKAPSRLKVARRATSMREITRLLASDDLTEHQAAETMLALVTALGRHDRRTRGHSERVRLFCDLLSRELDLAPADAGRLRWSALIHDIGKLEVAAAVLNKPGQLNAEEWGAIKQHPEAGSALAAPLASWLGQWFAGIAEHHERYDGTGYPKGLAGHEISVAGRAVAVVDAFETMTAARSYKAVRSTFSARQELTRCAGSHFDPAMVRAFLQIALPRLLWSVGPLAFVVNMPFLRWVGEGGARVADVAAATTATAASAAGVTAVAVAVGALPHGGGIPVANQPGHSVVKVFSTSAARGEAKSAVAAGGHHGSTQAGVGGVLGGGSGIGTSGAGSGDDPTGSSGSGSSGSGTSGSVPIVSGSSGSVPIVSGSSGSGSSGGGVLKTVGDAVGSVSATVGSTVDQVGKTVDDTVGGITDGLGLGGSSKGSSGKGSGGSTSSGSGSGSTGSGTSGSGTSGSGTSGSGTSGSGTSGSDTSGSDTSGSDTSGSGSLGGVLAGTICSLPLGLCPDSSHSH